MHFNATDDLQIYRPLSIRVLLCDQECCIDGLRDLIEANASAAQRGPLTRIGDTHDDDDNERSETVGAAIEGAATTTTDQARQVAALVSNQPSYNNYKKVTRL